MSIRYRNRTIINQRGGSIDIDNSTDIEKIQLSHRSGSNLNFSNVVTSELATNNKQLMVINDSYKTVAGVDSEFVGTNKFERIVGNTYTFKGIRNDTEVDIFKAWRDVYRPISKINSQFGINRGGFGFPNGDFTSLIGNRAPNPALSQQILTVENKFSGYVVTPIRNATTDQVTAYVPIPNRNTVEAKYKSLLPSDIRKSAGAGVVGSKAPGVIEFGENASASTENGTWNSNSNTVNISKSIIDLQDKLLPLEQQINNGGDDISFIKRNKSETVGAVFNDYPSARIDPKGRSQPFEIIVSEPGAWRNYDYAPVLEDIDNSSTFPCGNEDKIVGNKYNITVGAGGINFKTVGTMELGGTSLKAGFQKINMSATHGIHLFSESLVELTSIKSITLRTNRQVYIESSLGVKNNSTFAGGTYTEGEVYLHHITAPIEIQQTLDTTLLGRFNCVTDRTLPIGEVFDPEWGWLKVYALARDNLTINYPHSHHFANVPLRLCESNVDVRRFALDENINIHGAVSPALEQKHERRRAEKAPVPL